MTEKLLRTKHTNDLAAWYFDGFIARTTELFPLGTPTETLLWDFLHRQMTEVAGRALCGDLIFDINPGYLDTLFKFDLCVVPIAFGPPRWVRPQPHRDREAMLVMHQRYMAKALELFNWDSPVASSEDWDPILGSPIIRSLARWGLDIGLDRDSIGGLCGFQISAQNSNSVPATAWALMSSLTSSDPDLLPNLHRESLAGISTLPNTATNTPTPTPTLDIQKLLTSPWLQAVYTEVLRLHVASPLVRDADRTTHVDGIPIPKGAMVQAPMTIAHNNPIWTTQDGHTPQEFWPQRHLTSTVTPDGTKKWEFSIGKERSGYFFPYGGGVTMCPGRNFAKQEIIGTMALFLARFELEVVEWVVPDGGRGEVREARNGEGMVVCQPDRDLKVRVTRRW
jgi:cytochrome P450